MKNIAQNKKARHDYAVLETFEAGIVLTGTEVKSCRAAGVSLVDAYARIGADGQMLLLGVHIAPYEQGNRNNHDPRRDRVLLVHKREVLRFKKNIEAKGLTLVPLAFYFNEQGRVKVELGLCRGRASHDKRDEMKRKDDEKEMQRIASRHR